MATRTYDANVSVVGKVTQTGTPSSGGDLATKTYVDTEVATKQAANTDLTDLVARWIAASAAGPASLAFAEDTDNGTNIVTLSAPATIAADVTVTLPGTADTLVGRATTDTLLNKTLGAGTVLPVHIAIALSDETTTITTGVGKAYLHLPYQMNVTAVFAELNTVSSSGLVTVDINEGAGAGTSILSTKLTIDASEETSGTAATAAVISDTSLAQYARISFDIDGAGTGAKGLKVHILGTRTV